MKITEELRESWRKEFKVQTALGLVGSWDDDKMVGVKINSYRVKFSRKAKPAVVSEASVIALHAHHAVSIVLGWDRGNLSFNSVRCDKAGWYCNGGWNEYED